VDHRSPLAFILSVGVTGHLVASNIAGGVTEGLHGKRLQYWPPARRRDPTSIERGCEMVLTQVVIFVRFLSHLGIPGDLVACSIAGLLYRLAKVLIAGATSLE
jgi:hypothetical protein